MADQRPISLPDSARPRPVAGAPDNGFGALGVPPVIADTLAAAGIHEPFPIQTATLPDALAGRDILGRGRTGSGKTLAFVLPILVRLSATRRRGPGRRPRALILAPTRELARQIVEVIEPLAAVVGLDATCVFGGMPMRPQVTALRRGIDILVACPGRLEDHLRSGTCRLSDVEITVLDEADHMADLGFLPAVKRILDQTPEGGQRMLFSATLDQAVKVVVDRYLSNPMQHSVDDDQATVPEMAHHVLHVTAAQRVPVLVGLASGPGRKLVFTRTKHRAKTLAQQLRNGGVGAIEMHSNLSQGARVRNLDAFKSGQSPVLVATDIAAHGLHIDDVELVIHADPPIEYKAYLHRSGRTARAGSGGTVVTLATEEQRADVAKLGRRAGVNPLVSQPAPGQRFLLPGVVPGGAGSGGSVGGASVLAARGERNDEPSARPAPPRDRPRRRQPASPAAGRSDRSDRSDRSGRVGSAGFDRRGSSGRRGTAAAANPRVAGAHRAAAPTNGARRATAV